MIRAPFAVALFVAVALAQAAPVPKVKKGPPFPTAVGTRWDYICSGDEKRTMARVVTEREEKDGAITFKVESDGPLGQKHWETFRIADDEMVQLASTHLEFVTPPVLWSGRWKAGDEFVQKSAERNRENENDIRVGKAEDVITPAGTFAAVPVHSTQRKPFKWDTRTEWYADGVGLVRLTTEREKKPVWDLKSFTPGKDKK